MAGAGGLLPDGGGAGLEAFGLVELALVEEAVGEGVLAGQVRTDAEVASCLAGENAFTYGLLHEREHDQAGRLQARVRTVWKKASRPRHRKWMR